MLSIIGFKHKNNVKNYKEYEDKLIDATKAYLNVHRSYPNKGSSISINIKELISEEFIDKKDVVKGCSGTIIVKYDKFIDYLPNLKCKYYKSIKK